MQILSNKDADVSKIKRVLVLKNIFSEIAYLCVLKSQISSLYLWHNSNEC